MLMTKILLPDQFNAETISDLMRDAIGASASLFPPSLENELVEIAQYVLNSLESRAIVSRTEILQPAKLNSTTIAILMWERTLGPNAWTQGTEEAHMVTIDQAQYVLDALYQRGIIG